VLIAFAVLGLLAAVRYTTPSPTTSVWLHGHACGDAVIDLAAGREGSVVVLCRAEDRRYRVSAQLSCGETRACKWVEAACFDVERLR
jgi:hypothetical protein